MSDILSIRSLEELRAPYLLPAAGNRSIFLRIEVRMKLWIIPAGLLILATLCAVPLSAYFAWIMDGKFRAPKWLRWFENKLDTGEQTWKGYAVSLIVFNIGLFVTGFVVLALQPWMPFNHDHKGMLAPTTIFNSVISFMTNTNLQHYSGDVHLSNFSQVFFCILNMFLSASVGFCALVAIIRSFRGQKTVGNFFVDMWRVFVYLFLPASIIFGVFFYFPGISHELQKFIPGFHA